MSTVSLVADNPKIEITSMYGAKSHEPAIVIKWGQMEGQLTVAEARAHALRILEVAEGAEGDAFLADWFRQFAKADDETVAMLLRDFRKARTLRSEKEGGV